MENRFTVESPIKFKGETTVKDNKTGEIFKAEFRFIGKGNPMVKREEKSVTFELVEDENNGRWELVVYDGGSN